MTHTHVLGLYQLVLTQMTKYMSVWLAMWAFGIWKISEYIAHDLAYGCVSSEYRCITLVWGNSLNTPLEVVHIHVEIPRTCGWPCDIQKLLL